MCPGTLLLGNARSLLDDTAGVLTDGYQRLGPVFRIRAAWRRYTVVAGPETADFMAQGLDKAHLSREQLFGAIAREFGRADLILKEIGPRHARLRPPLAVAYSRQVASPHVPAMVDAVRHHVRRWPVDAPLGVVAQARELAFLQYGALLGTSALAFRDCQLMTTYLMNVAARVLPPIVLRAPWYRRAHGRTYGALTALVRERRSRIAADRGADEPQAGADTGGGPLGGRSGGPFGGTGGAAVETAGPTLVDALASVRDPSGTPFTEDEVVSYAAYGIGASIGYVGRLTSFMLYEILRDPAIQAELVAEARHAFAAGRVRDAADVRRMRLLRSVYDETLRLHSLAIGMAFDVASDFEFLGHQVRKGDALVVSPVPSSYDPEHFPDPHRFDAARCREPRNEHRRPGACMPFGVGDRTCAAMGLVELMSMVLVATTLHERAVAMDPPRYVLRRVTFPLPSPDAGLRMRAPSHARPDGYPDSQPGSQPPAAAAHVSGPSPAQVAGEMAGAPTAPMSEEESLASFPGHDQPVVRDALTTATRQGFAAGAVIVREGEAADAFYLLERGSVEVTRAGAGVLATLSEGDWFGEAGLLQRAPRNATVTAGAGGAVARVLGGDAFLDMVAASDLVASDIGQLLRKRAACARLLDVLPHVTAAGVSRWPEFTRRLYRAGETILRQGEAAEEFFVLVSGEVEVSRRDGAESEQVVATLGPGDYFGEMGLLHRAPRNATIVAAGTHDVDTLVTGRAGFDRLLAESGGARGELARAMLARAERLS